MSWGSEVTEPHCLVGLLIESVWEVWALQVHPPGIFTWEPRECLGCRSNYACVFPRRRDHCFHQTPRRPSDPPNTISPEWEPSALITGGGKWSPGEKEWPREPLRPVSELVLNHRCPDSGPRRSSSKPDVPQAGRASQPQRHSATLRYPALAPDTESRCGPMREQAFQKVPVLVTQHWCQDAFWVRSLRRTCSK